MLDRFDEAVPLARESNARRRDLDGRRFGESRLAELAISTGDPVCAVISTASTSREARCAISSRSCTPPVVTRKQPRRSPMRSSATSANGTWRWPARCASGSQVF
jgi:hypothetical protein